MHMLFGNCLSCIEGVPKCIHVVCKLGARLQKTN